MTDLHHLASKTWWELSWASCCREAALFNACNHAVLAAFDRKYAADVTTNLFGV
jgi:hypothetical protein